MQTFLKVTALLMLISFAGAYAYIFISTGKDLNALLHSWPLFAVLVALLVTVGVVGRK
jgi:FtsH-binding integral membrane protein